MENKKIEQQLQEINEKLNIITAQMEQQQKRQRELDELKEDLTLIGKDFYQAAVVELDEVAEHFDAADMFYLMKKVLRNTRNMIKVMDQMESVFDLARDVAPLTKEMVDHWMEIMETLDKKGYFEFAGEIFKIVDTVVTSFTPEDVRMLRENITSILLTIKNLTQPEMLSTMNNALGFFRKMDIAVESDVSYWALMKQMRDPEMKRGLAFVIQFMKNMANPDNPVFKLEDNQTNQPNKTMEE